MDVSDAAQIKVRNEELFPFLKTMTLCVPRSVFVPNDDRYRNDQNDGRSSSSEAQIMCLGL